MICVYKIQTTENIKFLTVYQRVRAFDEPLARCDDDNDERPREFRRITHARGTRVSEVYVLIIRARTTNDVAEIVAYDVEIK